MALFFMYKMQTPGAAKWVINLYGESPKRTFKMDRYPPLATNDFQPPM
jgi:hypothetical protein